MDTKFQPIYKKIHEMTIFTIFKTTSEEFLICVLGYLTKRLRSTAASASVR